MMIIQFSLNVSNDEKPLIKNWLKNNEIHQCQIARINGIDYNIIVVFQDTQIVAVRMIK